VSRQNFIECRDIGPCRCPRSGGGIDTVELPVQTRGIHAFGAISLAFTALIGLTGCEQPPRGAAFEREIVAVAEGEAADFAVYAVDRALLVSLADGPSTGERRMRWIPTSGSARTQVIAPGGESRITIWDSNENALLSSDGQRQVQIEALSVASDGSVFVPCVGNTEVSGLTLQLAREHLQDEMDMVVPSAQVQLTLVEGRKNSVDLVGGGGMSAPGAYRLPDRNYTILNLLAAGAACRLV
jgi:polysaccharide export outer membrane protein